MNEIWEKKSEAHKWFDRLWNNHEERDKYYKELAKRMNIDYELCHFSKMTIEQLDRAIIIIKQMWLEKFDR